MTIQEKAKKNIVTIFVLYIFAYFFGVGAFIGYSYGKEQDEKLRKEVERKMLEDEIKEKIKTAPTIKLEDMLA